MLGICSVCLRETNVIRNRKTGKYRCNACYQRSIRGHCQACKKPKVIQAKGLCYRCYQIQRRGRPDHVEKVHREVCVNCGRTRPVSTRLDNGTPVCNVCRAKKLVPQKFCSICGRLKPNCQKVKGKEICYLCRRRKQPKKPCRLCGQLTTSSGITDKSKGIICPKCQYRRKKEKKCFLCGKLRKLFNRARDGHLICSGCYKRSLPKENCSLCGKLNKVYAHQNGQPVCYTCRQKERSKVGICRRCKKERPIHARGLCNPCSVYECKKRKRTSPSLA